MSEQHKKADNGFDRCIPPNPYECSRCDPPKHEPLSDKVIATLVDRFTDVSYGSGEGVQYFDEEGFARAIEKAVKGEE